MPESEDLTARIKQLEAQSIEHDARLDTIEADSRARSQANRELIQHRFTQAKQAAGIGLALTGFVFALYVAWGNIDKDARSALSGKFIDGAIPIALGVGGWVLAAPKK